MSCWMPSSSQEAWFPQLRLQRLERETAEIATKKEEEQRKARAKRKAAFVPAEPSSVEPALF